MNSKDIRNESLAAMFGEVIHTYTRAQAIDDGVLVDVSETAKEAGFRFPVALTRAVCAKCVEVPPKVVLQDEEGRLWDVLCMAFFAIKRARQGGEQLLFKLHVRNDNRERTPPLVTLKLVCGPGDDAEPVITIMLPDED
jgi:hypothetical protein